MRMIGKETSRSGWRKIMADLPLGLRRTAGVIIATQAVTMVATQAIRFAFTGTHLIYALAPPAASFLFFGPLTATMVGTLRGICVTCVIDSVLLAFLFFADANAVETIPHFRVPDSIISDLIDSREMLAWIYTREADANVITFKKSWYVTPSLTPRVGEWTQPNRKEHHEKTMGNLCPPGTHACLGCLWPRHPLGLG